MLATLPLLLALVAAAAERLEVRLGQDHGLPVDDVHEVAFDDDGLLWVATPVGVYRHDGHRFHPAVTDGPPHAFFGVTRRPGGGVFATDRTGRLFAVTDAGAVQVVTPGWVRDATVDDADRLWVVVDGAAHRRDGDGWTRLPTVEDERVHTVDHDGRGLVVCTSHRVLGGVDGVLEPLVSLPPGRGVVAAVRTDAGLVTLAWPGPLELWEDGQARALASPDWRGGRLERRGDAVWASWDHGMGVVRAGAAQVWPEVFGAELTRAPDGALAWGTARGVGLWPEPDTVRLEGSAVRYLDEGGRWTVGDGGTPASGPESEQGRRSAVRAGPRPPPGRLPTAGPRRVHPPSSSLWVASWQRGGVVVDGDLRPLPPGPEVRSRICPDDTGRAWTLATWEDRGADVLVSWHPDEPGLTEHAPLAGDGCAPAPDGGVWLPTDDGLWWARGADLRRVGELPLAPAQLHADDRLWAFAANTLCDTALPTTDRPPAWACRTLDGFDARSITDVHRVGDTLWVATDAGGLLRVDGDAVERHPASDTLGSRRLASLGPSPRGGVWITGAGVLGRFDPDTLAPLEELGPWTGVDRRSAADLVERADGDLWLGTSVGLIHVPAHARTRPADPPPVRLIAAAVDGSSVPLADLTTPPAPDLVELRFAAAAYRDFGRVRYRVRLDDGPPRAVPDGRIPLATPTAGEHRVAVQASRDGRTWSAPAVAVVTVARPWWREPWVAGLGVLVLGGLALALARARVALLLARERERTRIAMDLHDELGSGLGGIGLLAGLLESDVDADARRDLAARIRTNAADMHTSLSDLAASLRGGGTTVGSLLQRLAGRAADLFPGDDVDVRVVDPDDQAGLELSLPVRRELERIGSEALHNAARHGHPRRVVVGVARAGAAWRFWVTDDGAGFDTGGTSGGLGLRSMQERAARIGARITIVSAVGQGTAITVHFTPGARDARTGGRPWG